MADLQLLLLPFDPSASTKSIAQQQTALPCANKNEPVAYETTNSASSSPQANVSLNDLADYQRCWDDIHQNTLKQIQMIKDAEGKKPPCAQSSNAQSANS